MLVYVVATALSCWFAWRAEKAERKDAKNFEGWLKDTKKSMDKSSEDMRPFYEDIIFFATNRAEKAVLNTDKEGK